MWLYIWLGVTALALILEFITSDMVSIWFVGGGIIAMILSACGLEWYVHLPVFIVVSLLSMLFLRKFAIKHLIKDQEKTNADSVIDKEFVLLSAISFNQHGSIKVNDVVWTAVCEDDKAEIAEGTIVKVVGIKGNKYIVKEI